MLMSGLSGSDALIGGLAFCTFWAGCTKSDLLVLSGSFWAGCAMSGLLNLLVPSEPNALCLAFWNLWYLLGRLCYV